MTDLQITIANLLQNIGNHTARQLARTTGSSLNEVENALDFWVRAGNVRQFGQHYRLVVTPDIAQVVDASDLGLKPGVWPAKLVRDHDGTAVGYYNSRPVFVAGTNEVEYVEYRSNMGRVLHVYND